MNTPKFLFYFILTFPFYQLQSQNSSEDCRENLSIFAESAKIKNYKAAYEPWMSVRTNCPKYSLATFQYGELILKDFIKNSSSVQEEKEYIDDLLKLYDEWAANFPQRKGVNQIGKIYSSKGQAMIDNNFEHLSMPTIMISIAFLTLNHLPITFRQHMIYIKLGIQKLA